MSRKEKDIILLKSRQVGASMQAELYKELMASQQQSSRSKELEEVEKRADLIILTADLIVAGIISTANYAQLKYLIMSPDKSNQKLALNIINAKLQKADKDE